MANKTLFQTIFGGLIPATDTFNAERAPAYYLSWRESKVVGTETCDTIADGLATRTPEAANVHDV